MGERRDQSARDDPRPPLARPPALKHSVFVKLVAIMVTMAASLLLSVGGFFGFIVGPNLHSSVDVVLQEYTRGLAAGSLDLANATDLSARLNLQVRYEGPAGNWSTAGDLPRIDDVQQGRVRKRTPTLLRRNYYVVPAPDGGAYLFAWSLGTRMKAAHDTLVVLLLLVMVGLVVITYIVLKRLLGPLRRLNDGVDRLSAGQLDVVLPNETRDEFGRLTDAFNHMVGRVRAMIGARDQLLLDVSHELRSPLTRMKVALANRLRAQLRALFRHTGKIHRHNHRRHADGAAHGLYSVVLRTDRQRDPFVPCYGTKCFRTGTIATCP